MLDGQMLEPSTTGSTASCSTRRTRGMVAECIPQLGASRMPRNPSDFAVGADGLSPAGTVSHFWIGGFVADPEIRNVEFLPRQLDQAAAALQRSLMNVPSRSSLKACCSCSACSSRSGRTTRPAPRSVSRRRAGTGCLASPAWTTTSSPRSKSTSERLPASPAAAASRPPVQLVRARLADRTRRGTSPSRRRRTRTRGARFQPRGACAGRAAPTRRDSADRRRRLRPDPSCPRSLRRPRARPCRRRRSRRGCRLPATS